MAETETSQNKDLLSQFPEIPEKYARMNLLIEKIYDPKKAVKEDIEEARVLIEWVDSLVRQVTGDLEGFLAKVDKDRNTFTLALRLTQDEMYLRQLLDIRDEMMACVSRYHKSVP